MKRIVLATFLVLAGIGAATAGECFATKAKYDALSPGMTYAEAIRVMGCSGEELSRSDLAGYVTFMVMWEGRGWGGANMNAMFQNGRLISKAQMGLK